MQHAQVRLKVFRLQNVQSENLTRCFKLEGVVMLKLVCNNLCNRASTGCFRLGMRIVANSVRAVMDPRAV
jgi:hypothetical protein